MASESAKFATPDRDDSAEYANAIVLGIRSLSADLAKSASATMAGSASLADLVVFSHAALFSPALLTLEQALNRGNITNMPGLTAGLLRQHPPQSIPMHKGHLDQARKINAPPSSRPLHQVPPFQLMAPRTWR
jgi:hypothetical protein